MNSSSTHILTMKCRDQIGLVAAVSGFLADRDCNITRSSQFEDAESGNFFMRTSFDAGEGTTDTDLQQAFVRVASELGMKWSLARTSHRPRILILVSKYSHCLMSLLQRVQSGRLNVEIAAVVSNHPDLAPMAEFCRRIKNGRVSLNRSAK